MANKYSIFIKIFLIIAILQQTIYCNIQITTKKKPALNGTQTNVKILKGSIVANEKWNKVPEFKIFYSGQQTISDKEGFYSFNLNKDLEKISILICKTLNSNFENINTIKHLSINPTQPYKFFSFEKVNITDEETNKIIDTTWKKRDKHLKNKNFNIPKNCIVILMNPKYFLDIKNWNIKLKNNFIKLPQIILKKDFKEKVVHRQAAKSILRSLDIAPFHENISKKIKMDDAKNIEIILACR